MIAPRRRTGRARRALLALAVGAAGGGCVTPPSAPTHLEPNTFRLVSADLGSWGSGPHVTIEPDGRVTIVPASPRALGGLGCHGTLTAPELDALVGALEAADFLARDGERYPNRAIIDGPEVDLTLEVVAGPDAGRTSHVFYEPPGHGDLDRILAVVDAVGRRLRGEDACRDCLPTAACRGYPPALGAGVGQTRICGAEGWRDCTPSASGDVIDCAVGVDASVECIPELGWVPALRWALVSGDLVRFPLTPESPGLVLLVRVDVDNRGAARRPPNLARFAELRDDLGAVVPILTTPDSYWSVTLPTLPERVRRELEGSGSAGVAATSPVLTATSLWLALRERPFDGAPFGAPVPLSITDTR